MPTIGIKSSLGTGQDVGLGLNPARPIASFDMVALMRLLDDKAQTSIRHRSIDPLMDFVFSSMTEGARHIAHVPIDCRAGCSFCCRAWVDASPPEVLFAVKSMTPEQRERAQGSVEGVCRITTGVAFEDRGNKVNPPCPLLESSLCSVYEARPITCRTTVSTDVTLCEATFLHGLPQGFPGLRVWMTLRDSYSTALEGALIHSGLAYQAREWNESLRIALNSSGAEERWLQGEDDFTGAPASPAPAIFDSPMWRSIYEQAFGLPPS